MAVNILIESGASVNQRDNNGKMPLDYAISNSKESGNFKSLICKNIDEMQLKLFDEPTILIVFFR